VGEHQVAVIGLEIPDSETQTFPLVSLDPMSKPGLHPCISGCASSRPGDTGHSESSEIELGLVWLADGSALGFGPRVN